jgi:group I intron endonuclease
MLIYEAYNKNNGKVYVGLTTQTLEKRKSSHLRSAKSGSTSYFHKAIRKHGEDAFDWCVVAETNDLGSLYKLEQLFISLYEDWQTYNISLGGEHSAYGMKHTEQTKKVCGEYAKIRWDGKRTSDIYLEEVFLCKSYKEAKKKYNIPKTTWYRERKRLLT